MNFCVLVFLSQARQPGLAMRVLAVSGITLKLPAAKCHTAASAALRAWKMFDHQKQK